MAHAGTLKVSAKEAAKRMTMTVKITGVKRFRLRIWCMVKLIKLAHWVGGIPMKIVEEDQCD